MQLREQTVVVRGVFVDRLLQTVVVREAFVDRLLQTVVVGEAFVDRLLQTEVRFLVSKCGNPPYLENQMRDLENQIRESIVFRESG